MTEEDKLFFGFLADFCETCFKMICECDDWILLYSTIKPAFQDVIKLNPDTKTNSSETLVM